MFIIFCINLVIAAMCSGITSKLMGEKVAYVSIWIALLAVLNTWVAWFFMFQMLWIAEWEGNKYSAYAMTVALMYFFIVNPLAIAMLQKRIRSHYNIETNRNFIVMKYLEILILPVIFYWISVYISWLFSR